MYTNKNLNNNCLFDIILNYRKRKGIKVKLLYQFGIILGITFIGELLYIVLPLPIPASIYGLLIMLFCLCTKIVKLEQVKTAADFLIEIMPPMFIPSAVGIIVVWSKLREMMIPFVVIVVLSTIIVMVCTGWTAQLLLKKKRQKEGNQDE